MTAPLCRVDRDGDTSWRLVEAISFTVALATSVRTVVVPAGFVTDFASIPAPLRGLLDVTGRATLAAVLHDWLCTNLNVGTPVLDARQTDLAFRRALRRAGYGRATATAYWLGVRWGALANPHRRAGWLADAPAVVLLSLPLAPIALPAGLLALLGRTVLHISDVVLDLI